MASPDVGRAKPQYVIDSPMSQGHGPPANQLNVLDVAALVDKVKDLATGTLPKPQTQLRPNVPNPMANVNVLDIAKSVDALKGKPYPFPGPGACP